MTSHAKVWGGTAVLVLCVVGIIGSTGDDEPTSRTTSSVASAPAPTTTSSYRYAPPTTTTTAWAPRVKAPEWGVNAERVTITRVVDGDTVEVGDRKIRILGIDSCEMSTHGGREAKEMLQSHVDNPYNQPISLTSEPGVTTDRYGRELRYLALNGTDFGQLAVIYEHTAPYEGRNDASAAYMAELRDSETDDERDCSGTPTSSSSGSDVDVDVDVDRDHNLPDGALTGGYCARKWWC